MEFELNKQPARVSDAHPHLLDALREELGVMSAKDGCAPSGQCGACTVLVDGKPRVACQVPLERVADREVTTIEGLDPTTKEGIVRAFSARGALQCGFCTPGIIVRVAALLSNKADRLDRDLVARHLGAHLCRCTGYTSLLDAVDDLVQGTIDASSGVVGIGAPAPRYQGQSLALGSKPFVNDMVVPGMLHGALRLSEHARADVLEIDTRAAEDCPGVVAVLTAADVPGDLRVGLIDRDWPVFVPVGGRTSYLGDVLALVVAKRRDIARRAATLIEVRYRPLDPFVDPLTAIESRDDAVWGLTGNVLSRSTYRRGDVEGMLASSAHVVEDVFQTQRVEHAFLEPESTLAVPQPDGRLLVYSGGQGAWDDRDQIASVLGVPSERVVVEQVANGGAFGGKEDLSNQAQTALAAWLLQRPVKCTLSREESFLLHPKRHPIRIEVTAGCDESGKLTALRARLIGDSGPYASVGMKVLERAAGHVSGPYAVPAIDVDAVAVRTNNSVCGAFRGFGANQAQFAMEGVMDRLADAVGLNGWEIRARNVITPGAIWGPGQRMDEGSAGAQRCLDAVRDVYDRARAAGRCVGLGLGLKNSGLGNGAIETARAVVRFLPDGHVEVRHSWTEMGQGVHTVAAQVAVEELGVPLDRVRVIVDTTRELGAGQTTGSRGTLMTAGAVAAACDRAKADGCRPDIDYVGEHTIDWTDSLDSDVAEPTVHAAFGYAAQVVIADPESGEIERVVAAHDVGRAINPVLCEGQIVGSVHMGLGYATSEEFPCDAAGKPTNMTLRSLGIIRPKDMPPVDVTLIEVPQPRAPYGIKGVGEIGLVPTAGAVAAAYHAVDGQWRNTLPLAPPRRRLSEQAAP